MFGQDEFSALETEDEVVEQPEGDQGSEGQAPVASNEGFTALEDVIDGELDDDETDPEGGGQEEAETPPEVADPETDKRVQTPEENARYAEMRRQQEAQQMLQLQQQQMAQQFEMMRQQLPEAQIANLLAQEYGMPPHEVLQRLQYAQISKEAEQRGLTPQQVMWERQQMAVRQQEQQYLQAQQQYTQMQALMSRLQQEGQEVVRKYPTLTPDDLTEAVIFGHETNSIHMPLEYLVRAKHADKLFAADQQAARQEALAQVSGRMNNGLKAPQGKPVSSPEAGLTQEELFFANKMGISPAAYARNKV